MNLKQNVGLLTSQEVFLYPDSKLTPLPDTLTLSTALNGRRGIQLLLQTGSKEAEIEVQDDSFEIEIFCMLPIPVEYNTGDGVEQGGSMVLENPLDKKPSYATRLAPFQVFDCLKPESKANIPTLNGLLSIYITLQPKLETGAGTYEVPLHVKWLDGVYSCTLHVKVYDVTIPVDTFPVTNWFSLDSMCRFHNVEKYSTEFYEVARQYAKLMRRAHQTHFFINIDKACITSREPYTFDFEYLQPLISCFFDEGMQTMELGPLLSRGFLEDGQPDMFTDQFKCAVAPDIPIDTLEGYVITVRYVKALTEFLKKYGWEDRVVFHIHDEPDIHFRDEDTLNHRKRQYYLATSIVKSNLPWAKTIEAVNSAEFRGGIDIWVPGTAGYEARKDEFDQLIEIGETVWNYVCCGPQGHWLNRFLDFAVLKGRLLFWGFAKNRISGFLHWGFNQFPEEMNPFQATSCPNDTGLGSNFPCGDSFLAYPGSNGPWPSMRLEAARRGAEDVALLGELREYDEAMHDELVAKVFTDNQHYNDDPEHFECVYEELLQKIEAIKKS